MAYDEARGVTVMYGQNADRDTDTWEWDGLEWRQVAVNGGPTGANGMGLAYDSARQRTVLFGENDADHTSETWEWDGQDWTLVADRGPVGRTLHGMAYDTRIAACVVFGGSIYSATPVRDTWLWDGTQWQTAAWPSPTPRSYHDMAYDSDRHVAVLFGGGATFDPLATDTWEWDGESWRLMALSGPPPRYRAAVAYDSWRGVTVLFGGRSRETGLLGDTWEWNGTVWTQVADSGPSPRQGCAMAFDQRRGVTVLFSGESDVSDTWEWDGQLWTQVASEGPIGRYDHAMAYDSAREVVVLFGGRHHITNLDDTWEYDGNTWRHVLDGGPSPRNAHGMVYDEARQVMVVYGGGNLLEQSAEYTWEYDGMRWVPSATLSNGIDDRFELGMCYDALRSEVVLFGGTQRSHPTGDTWTYNGKHAFTEQPQNRFVDLHDSVDFHVVVREPETATYQWTWNRRPLRDGGPISGSRTDTLRVTNVTGAYTGQLQCFVHRSGCNDQLSIIAHLIVLDPTISLATSCPTGGEAVFEWANCTPGGSVALLGANGPGQFVIPNGSTCAGTALGLSGSGLTLIRYAQTSPFGDGRIVNVAPAGWCGRYLQLVDRDSCRVSNVVRIE